MYCQRFHVSEHPAQTPENKTPKTLKRNRNSNEKKKNTAKRKQKTKHRIELAINIRLWICKNHEKALYFQFFHVSEHPTQTPENQTPKT